MNNGYVGTLVADSTTDFTDFYETSFARVYKATWLLARDDDAAWDATQEAFERAYARWPRLGKEPWAAGWVMTTALNLARRNGSRKPIELMPTVSGEPSVDRVDVSRALAGLAPRQQHAVALFYIADLPIHEIALVMGVSEGTVKAHLAQARKALRSSLGERHD